MSDTITYEEALKRYEAGFIIESAETGRRFFKEWAKSSDKSVSQSQTFKPIEISGLWLREVGVKDSDSMYQFLVDYLTRN
ncbi:hypothetical protein [Paenibacillus sp. FSL L8-0709]|uniref:hypothetical protein n=1 Tax=Paenibacillus sp. FSL L8-0709 TaxID=2975312 RepID=UPI0030F9ADD8